MAVPLLLPMMLMLSAMAATLIIVFSRAVVSIYLGAVTENHSVTALYAVLLIAMAIVCHQRPFTAPDGSGGFPEC